jgi:molecular chaperone DnaK
LSRRRTEGEDADEIEAKTNALAQAAMKLGEAMYQSQQAEAGEAGEGGNEASGGSQDDDVVDADFEEVQDDDDKKAS